MSTGEGRSRRPHARAPTASAASADIRRTVAAAAAPSAEHTGTPAAARTTVQRHAERVFGVSTVPAVQSCSGFSWDAAKSTCGAAGAGRRRRRPASTSAGSALTGAPVDTVGASGARLERAPTGTTGSKAGRRPAVRSPGTSTPAGDHERCTAPGDLGITSAAGAAAVVACNGRTTRAATGNTARGGRRIEGARRPCRPDDDRK